MEDEIQYYLDENGGLWKKENNREYFFSRNKLEWVECQIVYIWPEWEYKYKIDESDAKMVHDDYVKDGIWDAEEIPFRYYTNDNDSVFAADIYGNEFYVLADMTLKAAPKGTVDIMWGGLTKEEAEKIVEKQYGEGKWVLTAGGNRLIYGLDDYDVAIYVNETDPKTKTYKTHIILDDGMGTPAAVAYLEGKTIDELKKKVELEINNRIKMRESNLTQLDKATEEYFNSIKEKMAKGEL